MGVPQRLQKMILVGFEACDRDCCSFLRKSALQFACSFFFITRRNAATSLGAASWSSS